MSTGVLAPLDATIGPILVNLFIFARKIILWARNIICANNLRKMQFELN